LEFTAKPSSGIVALSVEWVVTDGVPSWGFPVEADKLWTLFQIDQQRITALDTIMITIRGWTITVMTAIAGFSLSQHDHSILLAAVAGTVLFGLLDVRYRRTQLLHASRVDRIEEAVASEYRLRPRDPGWSPWLKMLIEGRYGSSVSFYLVVLLLLSLLWVAT
jgi:uncharacterized membrane protein